MSPRPTSRSCCPRTSALPATGRSRARRRSLDRALADRDVDVVITLGILTSQQAARAQVLPKPVIAPLVIDPVLQGYPLVEGRSGRHNFAYVADFQSVANEVRAFHEIVGFKHMVALVERFAAGRAAGSCPARPPSSPPRSTCASASCAWATTSTRCSPAFRAGCRRGVRDAAAIQRGAGARARRRPQRAQATHVLGGRAAARSKPAC